MSKTKVQNNKNTWNLSLLYSSPKDPQIEKDVTAFESEVKTFADRYDIKNSKGELVCFSDDNIFLDALKLYEKISANQSMKALLYFMYSTHMDARNNDASAKLALLENRITVALSNIVFFSVSLSKISLTRQKELLADKKFAHFKVFLERIFSDAKYMLSVAEEKIMSVKDLPARSMWVSANERILSTQTVSWKGKQIPVQAASQLIPNLPTAAERKKLFFSLTSTLKKIAPFAEAEINAVFTDKKINDELRKYATPYETTVVSYRNDPKVVDQLRKVVTDNVKVAHDFYRLKAKLLKQKSLAYYDRGAKIGVTKSKYTFDKTISILKDIFGSIDPQFKSILEGYIKNGQIDVLPRVGKRGGAYCSSSYHNPTFILLNHTDDLHSFTTCAHELGHAFHFELSQIQSALYSDISTSLAETASTLFESIAFREIYKTLSDKEKIIVLHDRINDDISTIFRQIACFNFELDLHAALRAKGYLSKEEIADIHNKNMSMYLGPVFNLKQDDGYFFVTWPHIRNFFYVYTYAYGMLVSKALLRRYKKDPSFWKKIEQFLSAGGKDSPENILKEIGIDVSSPDFFKEGLMEIADDIKELERLTKKVK